jgi:uncharacterized repeat protein (TIGR01451 family)
LVRSVSRVLVLVGILVGVGPTGSTPAIAGITPVLPPSIQKSFSPDTISVGQSSTLTITLTNFNQVPVTGVGFTDTLPAGVVVDTTAATNSCGGTLTAVPGSSSISLAGGSMAAESVCSVVVDVVGTTEGVKVNTTSAVATNESAGGQGATATLTVLSPYSLALGVESLSLSGRTVRFRVGAPATVRFSLDRRVARNRYRRVGKFSTTARRGRNRARVPRRLSGRRVGKGVFRLSARAVNSGGRGPLSRRIVRVR